MSKEKEMDAFAALQRAVENFKESDVQIKEVGQRIVEAMYKAVVSSDTYKKGELNDYVLITASLIALHSLSEELGSDLDTKEFMEGCMLFCNDLLLITSVSDELRNEKSDD